MPGHRPFRSFLRAAWMAACAATLPASIGAADPPRPHIVLIMADDLGYGDLGCYGQRRIRTPRLDALAAEGLRFTQFYAGSTVCAPSRCTLMTGYHTGHAFLRGNGRDNLRPQDFTLAEALRAAGYRTALVGKWGLGHEGSTGLPTRQGFDTFYGYLDQGHAHNYFPEFLIRGEQREALPNVVPRAGAAGQGVATERRVYSHDALIEEALGLIDGVREEPLFLYLALTIPHANNEAGLEGMETPDLGPYAEEPWPAPQRGHAAMIGRMDRDVGRLVDRLRERGLGRETLVLFTSDNGPHAESGCDPEFNDSNGPLRGHKRDLTEGGIRVPLIAWWPGRVPAGRATDQVSANWDLLPTLAGLAGAGASALPADLDGVSLAATLLGGEAEPHPPLYWSFYERGGGRALRRDRWKIIEQPLGTPARLYDLETDAGEDDDVAARHPERVAELIDLMNACHSPSPRWPLK